MVLDNWLKFKIAAQTAVLIDTLRSHPPFFVACAFASRNECVLSGILFTHANIEMILFQGEGERSFEMQNSERSA